MNAKKQMEMLPTKQLARAINFNLFRGRFRHHPAPRNGNNQFKKGEITFVEGIPVLFSFRSSKKGERNVCVHFSLKASEIEQNGSKMRHRERVGQ